MITVTKQENVNYLAKVVRLQGVRKHQNADRLQCVSIDYNNVVTGLDALEGSIYVYFPVESAINSDFLSATNSFRNYKLNKAYLDLNEEDRLEIDNLENKSKRVVGFFEDTGRVKPVKLRGEISKGYIVPIEEVKKFFGEFDENNYINVDFDTIYGTLVVEKYKVPVRQKGLTSKTKSVGLNRLIQGQFRLHKDTENLEKNAWKISPFHNISITYKTHGTSWVVGNVKVKRKLNWVEEVLQRLGVAVNDEEYDYVYSSRRVVKNDYFQDPKRNDNYYTHDLWEDIKDELLGLIPKGFTLYGEALGFTKAGQAIQKGYDYGCKPNEMKLEVYRITQTNEDGEVIELSHNQITQFCEQRGLNRSKTFHHGKAYWVLPDIDVNATDWTEQFISKLREDYTEKDCHMCTTPGLPEEGIVLRVDDLYDFVAFKLKSFRFLQHESKQLDQGEPEDIEDIDIDNNIKTK